jgi:hypothetical protein
MLRLITSVGVVTSLIVMSGCGSSASGHFSVAGVDVANDSPSSTPGRVARLFADALINAGEVSGGTVSVECVDQGPFEAGISETYECRFAQRDNVYSARTDCVLYVLNPAQLSLGDSWRDGDTQPYNEGGSLSWSTAGCTKPLDPLPLAQS